MIKKIAKAAKKAFMQYYDLRMINGKYYPFTW